MTYLYIVLALLALGYVLYGKLKNLMFKAKDVALVKEDEALKTKQGTLEQEIQAKRQEMNSPVPDMTPEEVEEFWKKDKK